MKLNNKGFMMAEVVVVSSIILIFMTVMYTSYSKIFAIYKERVNYYDVPTLYKLAYYRDSVNNLGTLAKGINTNDLVVKVDGLDSDNDTLLVVRNYGVEGANNKVLSDNQVTNIKSKATHQTFKDYIDFMKTHVSLNGKYVLILESCKDENTCKYAYLDYDGSES